MTKIDKIVKIVKNHQNHDFWPKSSLWLTVWLKNLVSNFVKSGQNGPKITKIGVSLKSNSKSMFFKFSTFSRIFDPDASIFIFKMAILTILRFLKLCVSLKQALVLTPKMVKMKNLGIVRVFENQQNN